MLCFFFTLVRHLWNHQFFLLLGVSSLPLFQLFIFRCLIILFSCVLMEQQETSISSSCYRRFEKYLDDHFHFRSLVWIFFIVNLLNYIERSIIPGSVVEIREYVQKLIGHDASTYVGLLQSSFIMGFSIASIIFGCSASIVPPL